VKCYQEILLENKFVNFGICYFSKICTFQKTDRRILNLESEEAKGKLYTSSALRAGKEETPVLVE